MLWKKSKLDKNSVMIIFHAKSETKQRELTPAERTKEEVYATGNKWAIENWEATHD